MFTRDKEQHVSGIEFHEEGGGRVADGFEAAFANGTTTISLGDGKHHCVEAISAVGCIVYTWEDDPTSDGELRGTAKRLIPWHLMPIINFT